MKKQIASVSVLLALFQVACSDSPTTPVNAASPQAAPTRIEKPEALPDPNFDASGPLIVENQVDVAAQREGMLSNVLVDTGSRVRKGQLMAVIDNRQLQAERDALEAKRRSIEADLQNWEARVKLVEVDMNRAQKMWEAQLITKEQLDHAQYEVVATKYEAERERQNARTLEAQVRAQEIEIEKSRVTAPFDGVVARRYIKAGQKVSANDRLFWVTATAPLRVRFTLPESYVGRVKAGQFVSVTSPLFPAEVHRARILNVSPVLDPSSSTIELLAELQGKPVSLQPGMTANIMLAK
jgi:membrane fusion protein, multidrug efflux system